VFKKQDIQARIAKRFTGCFYERHRSTYTVEDLNVEKKKRKEKLRKQQKAPHIN